MEQTLQELSIKLFPPKTLQNCIDSFFHDHPKSTLSWIIKKGLQSVCVFLFVYRSLLMCLTWPPKNETLPLCSRLRKVGYLSWFAERKKQKKRKRKKRWCLSGLWRARWGSSACQPMGSRTVCPALSMKPASWLSEKCSLEGIHSGALGLEVCVVCNL